MWKQVRPSQWLCFFNWLFNLHSEPSCSDWSLDVNTIQPRVSLFRLVAREWLGRYILVYDLQYVHSSCNLINDPVWSLLWSWKRCIGDMSVGMLWGYSDQRNQQWDMSLHVIKFVKRPLVGCGWCKQLSLLNITVLCVDQMICFLWGDIPHLLNAPQM